MRPVSRSVLEATSFDSLAHVSVALTVFQIVKERQMAFDPEGDRETLFELFGRDADSLGECVGPVRASVCRVAC